MKAQQSKLEKKEKEEKRNLNKARDAVNNVEMDINWGVHAPEPFFVFYFE